MPAQPTAGHRSVLAELDRIAGHRRAAGLHRELRPRPPAGAGQPPLDLASNDYLGLHDDSRVTAAAARALRDYGLGATGSRLVTGATELHDELERELAGFLGLGSATVLSSGYLANLAAVTALAGRGDLIVSDAGCHASLIDACRLSRARVGVTPAGDPSGVAAALAGRAESRALVLVDAVQSADGAIADIAGLHRVCRQHSALLLVDEAHALGVVGPGGRGAVAAAGLAGAPDLVVTLTLSKSLGAQGGAVAGPANLRDHILNHARAIAAAWGVPATGSAVVPVVLCDPVRAVAARDNLADRGVHVGVFRPPSVPAGGSRLRFTARADLGEADLARAAPAPGDLPD